MKEPLPLATIQNAVIDFVRGRSDAILFGAQAVNVYVSEPRSTQDVDLMSVGAAKLTEDLREHLANLFHIALRVRSIQGKSGTGYRIFQLQKSGNRHLVDVRSIVSAPQTRIIDGVRVLSPAELIASKVIAHYSRRGRSKSFSDRRDLTVLLLAFPDLKSSSGPVADCLGKQQAEPGALALWAELAAQDLIPENEDDI